MDRMWFNAGSDARIRISVSNGTIFENTLAGLAMLGKANSEGEILAYTYEVHDEEKGETIRGKARIVIEHIEGE